GQVVDLEAGLELAVVQAVGPFRMPVAEPLHVERLSRRELDRQHTAVTPAELDARFPGVARAARMNEATRGRRHLLLALRVHQTAHHVPGLAVGVGVDVIERGAVVEVERAPQPVELRGARVGIDLRIARADRTDTPRAVTRTPAVGGAERDPLAGDLEVALVRAVL